MADDQENGAQLSTIAIDLAGDRPAGDPLAMERARARIELAMFGQAPPPRLGRYELLDRVAGGGMGLVYAAYDPDLDRKVALKVLHPGRDHDDQAHERLRKEARALARLDHPNVVKVHDVLSHDGQIVVVMALLGGETLASWEATPRGWHELVAAYLQAGDGLAAAHSVGVIHCDFKPSNAIISPAGDVRVLDFGLARVAVDGTEDTGATAMSSLSVLPPRTAPGGFLGTPAYASPEQLTGKASTAASDQFSFCVALHRAVEEVAPFAGSNIEELTASIRRGAVRIADNGRRIPTWLRRALRRGMAAEPARRFPSMRALLDELRRPRGWRRWRWPAITALLVSVAILAMAVLWGRARADLECDGAPGRPASLPASFSVRPESWPASGTRRSARRWRPGSPQSRIPTRAMSQRVFSTASMRRRGAGGSFIATPAWRTGAARNPTGCSTARCDAWIVSARTSQRPLPCCNRAPAPASSGPWTW